MSRKFDRVIKKLQGSSILTKLMYVIMLTVLSALTLTGAILVINERNVFRGISKHSISTLASVVGSNCAAALAFNDRSVATEIMSALRSDPEIQEGCLYLKTGEMLTDYLRNGEARRCPKVAPRAGYHYEQSGIAFSYSIIYKNENLGSIYLISDMRSYQRRLQLYVFLMILVVGVVGSGAFFLALRLQKIVTEPIVRLTQTARAMSRDEKYSIRAEASSEVEINALVEAFNRLIDVIQEREIQIRHSEELFRATFDVAAVGKALVAPNGRFIRVNSALCSMLGYSSEELLQRSFRDITYKNDKDVSEDVLSYLINKNRSSITFEKRYLAKNGDCVWTLVSAAPIRDALGGVEACISVIQNITDRKLAERERDRLLEFERRARHDAEKSVKARDDFLSIASHELRTPITPIKLHVQQLKRQVQASPLQSNPHFRALMRGFDISERQIDHLESLVEDLLSVSRITAGRIVVNPELVCLNEVVHDVLERNYPEITRITGKIKLDEQSKVEGMWDRQMVERIVTNLLSNALKYGGEKPIEITVSSVAGMARFGVRDYGIGIAKENQAKIFERFERVAPISHYAGLGLGLYISRELALAHGGTISVESDLGKGALLTLDLPLKDSIDTTSIS